MAGKLIYIGDGAFLPGTPTADHEEPDEEEFKVKIASGLYRSETGREIKEREAVLKAAKEKANAKAAEIAKAEAADARAEVNAAEQALARLKEKAEGAEARAMAHKPKGRK